jgi:hypothetical protein
VDSAQNSVPSSRARAVTGRPGKARLINETQVLFRAAAAVSPAIVGLRSAECVDHSLPVWPEDIDLPGP